MLLAPSVCSLDPVAVAAVDPDQRIARQPATIGGAVTVQARSRSILRIVACSSRGHTNRLNAEYWKLGRRRNLVILGTFAVPSKKPRQASRRTHGPQNWKRRRGKVGE